VKACVQNNPSEEIDTNLAGGIRNLSSLTVGILFLGYPGIPAAYIKIRPIARARYMGVEMDETEGVAWTKCLLIRLAALCYHACLASLSALNLFRSLLRPGPLSFGAHVALAEEPPTGFFQSAPLP
jgi:hypothetical protein